MSLNQMVAQFIPSFWLTAFPLLLMAGATVAIAIYWLVTRFSVLRPETLKSRLNLALFSIAATGLLFVGTNYASWRAIEKTTPTAKELRSAAAGGTTKVGFTQRFGEPSERSKSNTNMDTFEYPAIIKYDSGNWRVGLVTIEFNQNGQAVNTWTAD